jgi:YD repeat-containing protein
VSYDGPVLHPFFYRDDDWFEFAPTSPIAAYDRETHEEMTIVEAPCPGLAVATRDEAGNTYFSSWDYGPGQALYGLAPAPCTVRIGADLQLDEAWTTDHTAWTEGRFAMNFRYVGNGKAVADVLHHEEIDLDFSAAYDPAVEDAVWEGGHWRSWIFDLALGTGRPLAGLEPGGTGLQMVQIEGRTFLFAVYDSGGRTIAYELDSDGNLVERFRTPGEVFKWIRVR